MCFSAQASFFTAALLFVTWTACLFKVSRPNQLLLAYVPFFFGIQQFAEGMLWILIPQGGPLWAISLATYTFLSIAAFGWPLLISLAMHALEPNVHRRSILMIFTLMAVIWTIIGGYQLFTYGVTTTIEAGHMLYTLHSPYLPTPFSTAYYCAAVLLPFFIASNTLLNLLGIITTLSCIAAYFFWYTYFVSVWCFFAALISIGTYAVIISLGKNIERQS